MIFLNERALLHVCYMPWAHFETISGKVVASLKWEPPEYTTLKIHRGAGNSPSDPWGRVIHDFEVERLMLDTPIPTEGQLICVLLEGRYNVPHFLLRGRDCGLDGLVDMGIYPLARYTAHLQGMVFEPMTYTQPFATMRP